MKRSTERIITTHVGSLVRPRGLVEIMRAKESGQPFDQQEFAAGVKSAVAEVVRKQVEAGVDIPSDGEFGKPNFAGYVNQRLTGFERRERNPDESPIRNWGRDRQAFLEFIKNTTEPREEAEGIPWCAPAPLRTWGRLRCRPTSTILRRRWPGWR